MEAKSRRILGLPDLPVAATCVRVPVFVGHAEAVSVELERPPHRAGGYATPLDAAGTDPVWVSRIREDRTVPHGLHLWIVADNVRKGAALNAVQIAEALVSQTGLHPRLSLLAIA